ncbi:TPA: HAMP domain-containing sensor histidine kinase [Pseudomonas aeruginosa]|uniref:sensor histidine kinase n=1 Tax=Pseudomonas aeruginosa TaxID=287 RepID=UPI0018C6BDFC|nr:HAMP domain-containing sensor histidine kinase [Pseudomonas aeruginosa]MBG3944248.1 HAMP domain-containing histidine kinase [Pseudomonas aeruginosa]MBG5635399.1 HAMP domain-containing histidine kinase [Pseudomonas aeruginosa]MBG6973603.1 HAMP domain-containing histidine kinase [Pseudomonas aeruginosa]MBG7548733.1 HAMP domain-containing histidine kinase [Pseudomonas aeruginosa]MCU9029187.1 HAMP domain-containing histidine kinase [Pseudomonas aeruginosa]
MTTVLPLTVSATILIVSLVASTISVALLRNYVNETLEQKAAIFLNGFAGHIAQSGPFDPNLTQSALHDALEYQSTLGESSTAIGRIEDGRLLMHAHPVPDDSADLNAILGDALRQGVGTTIFSFQDGGQARLTKVYERGGTPFALSVLFDSRDVVRANRATIWAAIAINAALGFTSIAITFLITRRITFSLRSFSQRLAVRDNNDSSGPNLWQRNELAGLERALAAREQTEVDRSKAMEAMAQAERDALLGRVAAVIAHEVRNPLAGILNALSTIRRFGDDKTVRAETLNIVESGLKSLERIAEVTLATYRRRGETTVITASVIQDLDFLIAPEAEKKAIQIAWDLNGGEAFRSDADAIRQIMINLLLNACKASPAGGTIRVALAIDSREARLSVSDQGPGLPDTVLDYLQATPSSSALPSARELGISVICALVQDIGARLSVESHPGKGTTISVLVPLADDMEGVCPA